MFLAGQNAVDNHIAMQHNAHLQVVLRNKKGKNRPMNTKAAESPSETNGWRSVVNVANFSAKPSYVLSERTQCASWAGRACLLIVFFALSPAWAGQKVRVGIYQSKRQLVDTTIIFNPTQLYFAAPRSGNPALLNAIDKRLLRFKENPASVYYRSLRRWTSENERSGFPAWLKGAGTGAAGLLLFCVFWSIVLKRQVAGRTRELALRNKQLEALHAQMEQAEQSLRESELKYHTLFENAPDAIMLMRANQFVDCNARALVIFGCRREEIIGAPPYKFSPAVQPDGRGSRGKALEKTNMAARDGPQLFQWEHCRRDGTPFPAEVSLTPLELGGEILLQAIVRDVTERRRADEQIRRLNEDLKRHAAELEQRVAKRTAELAIARDHAEESDRLKSFFLATMSHELRTPLNSIIGFTGILLMGLVGPLTREQEKQLVMVQDSARHLLELINDVLDISKVEAGQIELAREQFDIRTVIQQSLDKISPLALKKGLKVTAVIAPQVGRAVGDRRRTEQILINLLSNAVKFTERGEVNIECRLENNRAVTQVSDTGIGIRPENMDKLFKPFRQLDSGLTRQYEGTGLGLAICKRLAESMGGGIDVASEWGKGSRFTFTLPLEGTPA
ncbi:MAG: ATP-binding protein [Kiritimatiellae bacterium]|nr:ATP-binding protein [Kiritimatiellia bacterium]